MRVVVAEKPSVARDIARVLGCERRQDGFFEGPNAIVTYAIGHLVNLPMPETLNPAWAGAWTAQKLPMIPGQWHYVVNPKTADQFAVVKRLLNARDTTEVVNAADAGREGEAIFRRIYAMAGCRKPVMRFWASSLTEEAIREAFERLRPAADYDSLADSAQTRAEIDWLWGMNYTRAYTITNGVLCTVGRVQTPTLALIVAREAQITGFVKSFFYQLHAQMPGFVAKALKFLDGGKTTFDFEEKFEVEEIQRAIPADTEALIESVKLSTQRRSPPQLYNLGALQKDANKRYGYTAARTLEIAQSLYENYKVLTYPRTSSRHIGTDMVAGLAGTLKAISFQADAKVVAAAIKRAENGPPLSDNYVDDAKLSDHHAILPTRASAARLSSEERNVYNLVTTRFLGIFLPDKITEMTRVGVDIAGQKFQANGSRVTDPGWAVLMGGKTGDVERGEDGEPLGTLPPLKVGERYPVDSHELKTKERKPPPRYNDATLIAAMETAGKSIEDDELRAIMKGKGLGTEATRSAIIGRLEQSEYIGRDGKFFFPTAKGTSLIAQVSERISSPSLTAAMEEKLMGIEQGEYNSAELREEIEGYLREDIPEVLAAPAIRPPAAAGEPGSADFKLPEGAILCPKCKAGEVRRIGDQAFYGCSAFRQGCRFQVWVEVAKKTLTEAQVKALCGKKGRTPLIKGFVSKAGKKFDAFLVLDAEFKAKFEFEK
ncbi:type IA DNA topoisomerase [Granulicella sibirica]|uniref:DNA topoisomerase n=1 Tax=Granulicella sibirica TaxID=2479048 RepID=A0A4Q0T4C4_9BACT|nr:type IA DNA topoisomerase [Granulicella sibirica]RXH58585.1 DNA topoisomerase III [Granulicella sibirica]